MIGDQGPYDPTGYIEGNPATYPIPIGDDPYYAGQFWTLTAPAVIGSDSLVAGDLLYVVSFGRNYGQHTYGDAGFGWLEDGPWYPIEVSFRGYGATLPAWERPAPPYSGCPMGDKMPGWRMVIEAQYLAGATELRHYGEFTFGSAVYGDVTDLDDPLTMTWNDITEENYGVQIQVGNTDGNPVVAMSEARLDFRDETAELFAMTQPESWYGPRVGTIIRVGVLEPSLEYHPLFVGRIEQVADLHDSPPRHVEVDAFGMIFDTVQTLPQWSRPTETADVRLRETGLASGYIWGPPSFPAEPGPSLLGLPVGDVVAREAIDKAAISALWYVSSAHDGRLRARVWPENGAGGQTLNVTDCKDGTSDLLTPAADLTGDMAELLNLVTIDNVVTGSGPPGPAGPPGGTGGQGPPGPPGPDVPAGVIFDYIGTTPPAGYLSMEGQTIVGGQTLYPALWANLAPAFKVGADIVFPNARGRVSVALDPGQTAFDAVGETGGAPTHTLTIAQLPSHDHPQYGGWGAGSGTLPVWDGSSNKAPYGLNAGGPTGGGQPFNIIQPYIVFLKIIRAY